MKVLECKMDYSDSGQDPVVHSCKNIINTCVLKKADNFEILPHGVC